MFFKMPYSVTIPLSSFLCGRLSCPSLLPLSLSAWPNRLFMGWNQCKCCEYHSFILLYFRYFPWFTVDVSYLTSHSFFGSVSLAMIRWFAIVVRYYYRCSWQENYTSHHAIAQILPGGLLGSVVFHNLCSTGLTFCLTSIITIAFHLCSGAPSAPSKPSFVIFFPFFFPILFLHFSCPWRTQPQSFLD